VFPAPLVEQVIQVCGTSDSGIPNLQTMHVLSITSEGVRAVIDAADGHPLNDLKRLLRQRCSFGAWSSILLAYGMRCRVQLPSFLCVCSVSRRAVTAELAVGSPQQRLWSEEPGMVCMIALHPRSHAQVSVSVSDSAQVLHGCICMTRCRPRTPPWRIDGHEWQRSGQGPEDFHLPCSWVCRSRRRWHGASRPVSPCVGLPAGYTQSPRLVLDWSPGEYVKALLRTCMTYAPRPPSPSAVAGTLKGRASAC
jgi:hypothetical protein